MTSFCCLYCYNFKQISHLLQLFLLFFDFEQPNVDWKQIWKSKAKLFLKIYRYLNIIYTYPSYRKWLINNFPEASSDPRKKRYEGVIYENGS